MMDSKEQILRNIREVVGFSGVRDFDFSPVRQETIERRLKTAQDGLSPQHRIRLRHMAAGAGAPCQRRPPPHVIERWCHYLAYKGCGKQALGTIWLQAALVHLNRWGLAMPAERVRDVRKAIQGEILAKYPRHDQDNAMDVDAMPNPSAHASSAAGTSQENRDSSPEQLAPEEYRAAEASHVCERCNVKGKRDALSRPFLWCVAKNLAGHFGRNCSTKASPDAATSWLSTRRPCPTCPWPCSPARPSGALSSPFASPLAAISGSRRSQQTGAPSWPTGASQSLGPAGTGWTPGRPSE